MSKKDAKSKKSAPDQPKSDAEILAWAEQQRRLCAAGELPQWCVERLEKIPGWTW